MAISGPTLAGYAAAAAAVAGAAATILAPKPKAAELPAAPTVAAATAMPTADDATVQLAKRRSIAEMQQQQGRASTILTAGLNNDKLGA